MKATTPKLILFIMAAALGLALLSGSIWAWRYYTAEVRGIVGQEERVQSPLHRMGAYSHFFDLCAAVQGHEATLVSARTQLADTGDEKERQRIRANIAGIEAQRARSIARYNADARKDHTIGQFRDSGLPFELDVNQEETRC